MSIEAYNRTLERLHTDYPHPKQSLTLRELCDVIPVKLKTLQNHKSNGILGFPVVEAGGKVLVSKETVAKLVVGLDPFKDVATDTDNKTDVPVAKRGVGRPRKSYANSYGLQRFARLEISRLLDEVDKRERGEAEGWFPKDLPPGVKKQM